MNEINNFLENFNDINTEKTFVPAEIEKNKVFPILAYLIPILFFLPICGDGNSTYCKFHANQSFTWLVCLLILGVIMLIVGFIPILGVLIARLIYPLLVLAIDAMFIYGSIKGKAYRLPLIGSLIKLF